MKQTEETITPTPSRSALVWLLLLTLGGITFYTRYHFVPALQTHNTPLTKCPQTIYDYLQYQCKEFDIESNPIIAMEIQGVTPDHGFISLEAFPILAKSATPKTIVLEMAVHTFAVTKEREILTFLKEDKRRIVQFFSSGDGQTEYTPQTLSEVSPTSHENYIVVIKLLNTNDIQKNRVDDIRLGFITFNPTFEKYVYYFKSFLFGVAIISWFLYILKTSSIPSGFATFEQRFIKYIGFFLAIFVQPFVGYSTFGSNLYYSLGFVGVTAALTTAIVSLWLYIIEKLASSDDSVHSGAKGAIICFAIAHLILIIMTFGFLAVDQSTNPLVDFQTDNKLAVTLCKYYVFVVLGLGGLWSNIRVCQILSKIKNLDWRYSNAFTFSLYYILCYGFFLATGTLQVLSMKGERLVLLLGITTMFVVILQAIYAPSGVEAEEANQRKKYDNPAVKGAYDDLSMSDMPSSSDQKDNIGLRGYDVLQKRADAHAEDEEEEEEDDV